MGVAPGGVGEGGDSGVRCGTWGGCEWALFQYVHKLCQSDRKGKENDGKVT